MNFRNVYHTDRANTITFLLPQKATTACFMHIGIFRCLAKRNHLVADNLRKTRGGVKCVHSVYYPICTIYMVSSALLAFCYFNQNVRDGGDHAGTLTAPS